ncbi:RNA polymerase sigma factor [Sphaerisporangium fuscum]|uniref:RNA polymerase sigma factor n=1 Tax=Sphaerisporangium fuscum TaxID=2835868 RepID=UPI001BDCDF72|nr:RNA polymerase sigma factor [Sphaerisporangium fuscum]
MEIRRRIRDGDTEAFEWLFDEFARMVYGHAFRLTGDWSVAEDVMSLTFLEAWRLRHRIAPDQGSLRPWLLGIATNVARNTRRAARRYGDAVARMPGGDFVPDFADEVAGRVDDAGQLALIRRAYAKLRRPEQEVFTLVIASGLSYEEAAQALGIPVGTVRSRLSRARKKLEKFMAEHGWPEPPQEVGGRHVVEVAFVREECR